MIWLAVIIGLITAIALPATFIIMSYRDREMYAMLRGELLAENLQLAIQDNPEFWFFDVPRFVETTHRMPQSEVVALIRISNQVGTTVFEQNFSPVPGFAITTKTPIKYLGQTYGVLEIVENMEALWQAAAIAISFFGFLGVFFAVAIYKFPLKIIRTAESKVIVTIGDLQTTQDILREMAIRDAKTNLFNASYLMQRLEEELAQAERSGKSLWLLMMDIDYFKKYNDTYGHVSGDVLLAELAELLTENVRSQDVLGRFGGEEFLLIMPAVDATQAEILALRMRGIVETHDFPMGPDHLCGQITVSIGMAEAKNGISAEQLIQDADTAMYAAKESGRNRVCTYQDGQFRMGGIVVTRMNDIAFESQTISELTTKLEADAKGGALSPDVVMLTTFLKTLLARESDTAEHCLLANKISMTMGRKLSLSEKELLQLNWGSLLHDIGKLSLNDSVLLKESALTSLEYATMKNHPAIGHELLKNNSYIGDGRQIVLYHHEKWDGTGYPHQLEGETIPLLVRICSVADSVAAMAVDRPYRKALKKTEILHQLRLNSGTQFDPALVAAFVSMADELFNEPDLFGNS